MSEFFPSRSAVLPYFAESLSAQDGKNGIGGSAGNGSLGKKLVEFIPIECAPSPCSPVQQMNRREKTSDFFPRNRFLAVEKIFGF